MVWRRAGVGVGRFRTTITKLHTYCTPGNEAADQLAKCAARGDSGAEDPMRALAL